MGKKWYVYYLRNNVQRSCICFEQDEAQAMHFACLVNGEAVYVY